MDLEFLKNLFSIYSPSYKEEKVADFIKDFLSKNKIPFIQDTKGNIYNLSNEKSPILSSHMDTVSSFIDSLTLKFIKERGGILYGIGNIGADDKCGIYIILQIIKERKVNFVFSVEEEVGGGGIREFAKNNEKILRTIPYGLVLDRKGSSDIICSDNFYGSEIFEKELVKIGSKFGFIPSMGVFSDADILSKYFSCANLSVGYYNAHTTREYVVLDELENTLNFVKNILDNVKTRFEPVENYKSKRGFYYEEDEYYMGGYDKNLSYGGYDRCLITGKKAETVYIKALGDFVSKEGALTLIEELQEAVFELELQEEAGGTGDKYEYY